MQLHAAEAPLCRFRKFFFPSGVQIIQIVEGVELMVDCICVLTQT